MNEIEATTTRPEGSPAAAGSGWILCADKMPDLDEIVFLFAPTDWIIIGNRSDDGEGWLWGRCYGHFWWDANASRWDGDCEQDDDYKPTHWRPLPYPPNVEVWQKQGAPDAATFKTSTP